MSLKINGARSALVPTSERGAVVDTYGTDAAREVRNSDMSVGAKVLDLMMREAKQNGVSRDEARQLLNQNAPIYGVPHRDAWQAFVNVYGGAEIKSKGPGPAATVTAAPHPCRDSRLAEATHTFLIAWRWAICSASGPSSPTTRFVLLTLSLFMRMDGTGAFPSQRRIALGTGLSLQAVKKHLAVAATQGWIRRRKRKNNDSSWASYVYEPLLPPEHADSAGAGNDVAHRMGDDVAHGTGNDVSQRGQLRLRTSATSHQGMGNDVATNSEVTQKKTQRGRAPEGRASARDSHMKHAIPAGAGRLRLANRQ